MLPPHIHPFRGLLPTALPSDAPRTHFLFSSATLIPFYVAAPEDSWKEAAENRLDHQQTCFRLLTAPTPSSSSALGAPLGAPAELPVPRSPPVPPQRPAGGHGHGWHEGNAPLTVTVRGRRRMRAFPTFSLPPPPTPRNIRAKLASPRSERGHPRETAPLRSRTALPWPSPSAVASPFYLPPGAVGREGPSALCRAGEVRSLFCATHAFGCGTAAARAALRPRSRRAPRGGRGGSRGRAVRGRGSGSAEAPRPLPGCGRLRGGRARTSLGRKLRVQRRAENGREGNPRRNRARSRSRPPPRTHFCRVGAPHPARSRFPAGRGRSAAATPAPSGAGTRRGRRTPGGTRRAAAAPGPS